MWLCRTVSAMHSIAPRHHRELFVDILSRPKGQSIAVQLLRMIFEKKPKKAGRVLAKKCYLLEKFFEGNETRILQFFDHFAPIGESGHRKGAKAISQYAFLNREECWEELVWKGNHGQSPAVVATKPHYFHDLDIVKTVENFLNYVPDFWSSDELAESVKDGEILDVDSSFFVDEFVYLMYEESNKDVWDIVGEFLEEEQFSSLCLHLLILDEQTLHIFLRLVGPYIRLDSQCKELKCSCCWLETVLSSDSNSLQLGDLILLNAVIVMGRQVLRLLTDGEHEIEKQNMEDLSSSIKKFNEVEHFSLAKECADLKIQDSIKWFAIQSWIHWYNLSKICRTPEACESLFHSNRIVFRKADNYSLVPYDLNDYHSDEDGQEVYRSRSLRKDKRNKKKRRKDPDLDEESSGVFKVEDLDEQRCLQSSARRWYLSTDNYSTAWDMVDIPEHLSSLYFKTWVKWVCS